MTRLLTTLALLAIALPAAGQEVVVKAAKVYTMTGAPLTPGAIRVKDGKIVEVAGTIAVPKGGKEIDLGTAVLLPGLIDAATSIGIEGRSSESTIEVTPNFRLLDAIDWSARSFKEARADGITAVALVPGTDNVVAGRSVVVKTAGEPAKRVVSGDHALVLTLASDPASGNAARNRPDSIYNRQPTNRMGVVWILRNEFARAKTSDAKDSAVYREALAGKRPVVCVSRTDADLTAALRLKQEFPMPMNIAGGQEAYKLRSEIAAAKVPLLLGPLTTNTSGTGIESTETVLNLAGTLHESGVTFALTGGKLLDQARIAVRHGLPKDVALASITTTPAKLLGLDGRLGSIAPGRDADLIALSAEPFDLSATVRWTMTDGAPRTEEP